MEILTIKGRFCPIFNAIPFLASKMESPPQHVLQFLGWDNMTQEQQLRVLDKINNLNPDDNPLNIFMTTIYSFIIAVGSLSNFLTSSVIVFDKGPMSPIDNYVLNLSFVDMVNLLWCKFNS